MSRRGPKMVSEGLFLGGMGDAIHETLVATRITHIVNVSTAKPPPSLASDFTYLWAPVDDGVEEDVLSLLPAVTSFVEEGRRQGGVLIHCVAGRSRSPTVMAAYLMVTQSPRPTAEQALEMIRKVRRIIQPNPGFLRQLQLLEQMECDVERAHQAWLRNRILNLQSAWMAFGRVFLSLVGPDPFEIQTYRLLQSRDGKWQRVPPYERFCIFICAACRTVLFKEPSVIHINTNGKQHICQDALFIEPQSWMGFVGADSAGELPCPTCKTVVGSWTWNERRCTCNTVESPCFMIRREAVMEIAWEPNTDDTP